MVPPHVSPPPSILVICGATGSGKGRLARGLAARLAGEVVSADSRKIYRRFDLGTAKPTVEERRRIPHHLVDVCDPDEVFTAGRFAEMADAAVADITGRGRFPIVCGGTGLYLRALLYGIIDGPPRDDALRERLRAEEAREPGCLHRRLEEIDPQAASRIPPGDLVRCVRALEVHAVTGRRISEMQRDHGFLEPRVRALQVAPDWPRDALHRRIDERVERMMQAGWLDEVRALRRGGLAGCRAFQSVGYRQLLQVLEGERTLEEAVASIKTEHRRYARRQLTWFRAEPAIQWLPAPVDEGDLLERVQDFLSERHGRG